MEKVRIEEDPAAVELALTLTWAEAEPAPRRMLAPTTGISAARAPVRWVFNMAVVLRGEEVDRRSAGVEEGSPCREAADDEQVGGQDAQQGEAGARPEPRG